MGGGASGVGRDIFRSGEPLPLSGKWGVVSSYFWRQILPETNLIVWSPLRYPYAYFLLMLLNRAVADIIPESLIHKLHLRQLWLPEICPHSESESPLRQAYGVLLRGLWAADCRQSAA